MNKGLSRLKKVKWASDDFLCQVKLFLSEDCPSQIGSDAEDHLQIKASLHSNGMSADDLPPGFGGMGNSYAQNQICISPQITWNHPPIFKLDNEWHVVAGEESEERNTQNYREMRVLEALYPRVSAIPPSPSVSPELEACRYDDSRTPIIPLNPIEDEDTPPIESTPCSSSANGSVSNVPTESKPLVNEKLHGLVPGLDADVIAAASAAYTATMKGNEIGSMVDTDLLIRILNEPKMIEALTKASAAPLSFMNNIPQPKLSLVPPTTSTERTNDNLKQFSTSSIPYSVSDLPTQFNSSSPVNHHAILAQLENRLRQGQGNGYTIRDDRTNVGKSTGNASSSALLGSHTSIGASQYLSSQPDRFTLPAPIPAPIPTPIRAAPAKDLDYYKSLIRLHGSGAEETSQEQFTSQYQVSLPEVTVVRPKSQKPCKFFNSPKGCRYGPACPFEHAALLDLRTGNYTDTDRSNKRLKISSNDLHDKC